MATGTIRGVIMGLAVSATGLAAVSIVAGPPPQRQAAQDAPMPAPDVAVAEPDVAAPDVTEPDETAPATEGQTARDSASAPAAGTMDLPAGSGFRTNRADTAADLPAPDAAPQSAAAPQLDGQDAPVPLDPARIDRQPGALPPADQDVAVLSSPDMPAPDTPANPDGAAQSDSPAPMAAAPSGPAEPAMDDRAPGSVARGPAIADAPQQPAEGAAAAPSDSLLPDRAAAPDATPQPLPPAAAPAPQVTAQRQALPRIEATPPQTIPAPTAPDAPVAPGPLSATESAPAFRPTIGNLATSLVDRPATTDQAPADQATQVTQDATPPLQRNALPFADPEDRPRLSIILMDRGASAVPLEALGGFPYPLTFAIDANLPDAPALSARYRAAGFEVMALVDLPESATAQDAETALEFALAAVPDATAVMEGDSGGFQSSKDVSDQVAAILRARGYGLVMRPNGLNTAQKLAARAGVPSATIFRDFDGAGQDTAAIRRFLDQGAFTAGQRAGEDASLIAEDGVIMLGRLRPDTISALLLWGLQDRSRRVALAPVSAVLTAPE